MRLRRYAQHYRVCGRDDPWGLGLRASGFGASGLGLPVYRRRVLPSLQASLNPKPPVVVNLKEDACKAVLRFFRKMKAHRSSPLGFLMISTILGFRVQGFRA